MGDPLEAAYTEAVAAHKRVAVAKRAYEAAAAGRAAALRVLRVQYQQSYHAIGRRLGITHGRVIQIINGKKEKP